MTLFALVTASRDRRRIGMNFRKRQETSVKLTGEDDPRIAKLKADPALNIKIQEIDDTDTNTSDKEDVKEKQRVSLRSFLLVSGEKPKVKTVSDAMGFKVTGAEIDELWAEVQDEKTPAS